MMGSTRKWVLTSLEVLKNGEAEPYHTEWQGYGVRVYIGSENVFIPRGDYTYTIRYPDDAAIAVFSPTTTNSTGT